LPEWAVIGRYDVFSKEEIPNHIFPKVFFSGLH